MSLNGLDSAPVHEAYQAALVDPGGWFLAKYVNRDSIELLGRGSGGVHEARNAIAQYGESSPLYGLLMYRRRKIVIIYVPSATSRLLQARTAVHVSSVLEYLSPYETQLEIATADDLNDTSLAAAFPLHTASQAPAANKLQEISEDGEDGGGSVQSAKPKPRQTAAQRYNQRIVDRAARSERSARRLDQVPQTPGQALPESTAAPPSPPSPKGASPSQTKSTIAQHILVREDSGKRSIASLTSTSAASVADSSSKSEVSSKERDSTLAPPSEASSIRSTSKDLPGSDAASERSVATLTGSHLRTSNAAEVQTPSGTPEPLVDQSSISSRGTSSDLNHLDDEPYDFSKLDFLKPKVKLGPRPVAAGDRTKRPTVASIASIPATYRPTPKRQDSSGLTAQTHTSSQFMAPAVSSQGLPLPPPVPDVPEYSPRPLSRGSIKSLPSHRSSNMTPDKIRLMKAVELRKKQLRKSNPQERTFVPPPDHDAPALPDLSTARKDLFYKAAHPQKGLPAVIPEGEHSTAKNPDSGIEMGYDKPEQHEEKKRQETLEQLEEHEQHTEPAVRQPTTAADSSPPSHYTQAVAGAAEAPRVETYKPLSPHTAHWTDRETDESLSTGLDRATGADDPAVSEQIVAAVPTIVAPDQSRPSTAESEDGRSASNEAPDSQSPNQKQDEDGMSNSGVLEMPENDSHRQDSEVARRRRGIVEPLMIEADDALSSDEDLDDQITLHEAKPITVSKSPVHEYFTRGPSGGSTFSDNNQSVTPERHDELMLVADQDHAPSESEPLSSMTLSQAQARPLSQSSRLSDRADPMGVTRNLGTDITRRIQALAEQSNRDTSPHGMEGSSQNRSSALKLLKGRNTSFNRHYPRMNSNDSQLSASELQRAQSPPIVNVQHGPAPSRNSVSVSARIVRRDRDEDTDAGEHFDGFQESQLTINHNRASSQTITSQPVPPIDTDQARSPVLEQSTVTPSMSPTGAQGSFDSTTQASRRRSSAIQSRAQVVGNADDTAQSANPPPNKNAHSIKSSSSNDQSVATKESSRTSRFFKRISNLSGKRKSAGRQSYASVPSPTSTVTDRQSLNAKLLKNTPDTPPAVLVGDLNVQFPDTLLWKRRLIEIDNSGYLICAIPQAMEHQKFAAKSYHLSEFKQPYIPDLDQQELPHSIMLDFLDGTTLQLACEDRLTHREVAHCLRTYWKSWTTS